MYFEVNIKAIHVVHVVTNNANNKAENKFLWGKERGDLIIV